MPIVNENDSVGIDEIKYGDNDTLSAFVANMAYADVLIILTDVDALYTANPRKDSNAKPVRIVNIKDLQLYLNATNCSTNDTGTSLGTGGMATKLKAAQFALSCGV